MIIDYSTARPSMSALKAAGVTAVGRYCGWDGTPGHSNIRKNLTKGEAQELHAAGIAVWLAFEYDPQAALLGRQQGIDDGNLATHQLAALGAPAGMAVYFALDFDIRDYAPHSSDPRAKLGPAAGYFDGIASLKPSYEVGVYGGYWAVSRVLDAGLADMAWQTLAWSGTPTKWDTRAVIRQEIGAPLAGADLDEARLHTVHGPDFGQWPRPGSPSPAPAGPAQRPVVRHVTGGALSLSVLAANHGTAPAEVFRDTFAHLRPGSPEWHAAGELFNGLVSGRIDPAAPVAAGLELWMRW